MTVAKRFSSNDILRSLRDTTRDGIRTAEFYLKSLADQFGQDQAAGLYCHSTIWSKAMKQARHSMVFHQKNMDVLEVDDSDALDIDQGTKIDKGAYAEYEACIGTKDKDWDGDIVDPYGYDFDMNSPVLWMHAQGMPVGRLKSIVSRDNNRAVCRFKVADTALGRDSVALMKVGALRKSIGFKPIDFTPLGFKKDDKGLDVPTGWHVKKCKILENSLVSVPANSNTFVGDVFEKAIDGIRTLVGQKKLQDPMIQKWAGSIYETRQVAVRGATLDSVGVSVSVHGKAKMMDVANVTGDSNAESMGSVIIKSPDPYAFGEVSLATKMSCMDPYMPGSFESMIATVDMAASRYVKNTFMENEGYCYTVATYSDMAIVCCREYGKDKRECYQLKYSVGNDGRVVIESGIKVEIQPTIVPVGGQATSSSDVVMPSIVTTKLEEIEKKLGHESIVTDEISADIVTKSIAMLIASDKYDDRFIENVQEAAETLGRLRDVAQLRAGVLS